MNRFAGLRWVGLALSVLVGSLAQAQDVPVGRNPWMADVSTTGAAQYVIPLALPPGTNGLAPGIAITYDSRGGNGLLGVGFSLSGLSSIRRCGNTLVQDGRLASVSLDYGDRFCLDGQRLRRVTGTYGLSGSTYQTEIERFLRVTALGAAGNGPAWFKVEHPDGLIYEYGGTADSRIEATGSTTVREWALSAVRDRNGNYVSYVYEEDAVNGSYRPSRIDYTGNSTTGVVPYYSLRFYYEARPADDLPTVYVAQSIIRETQRLKQIEVRHITSAQRVRRYDLGYASRGADRRARLASVQQCVYSSCLPATVFEEAGSTPGLAGERVTGLSASTAAHALPGDMDGDGYEDLAYFDSASGRWTILRGSASGWSLPAVSTGVGSSATYQQSVAIDLDGNGRRDLLVPDSAGYWYWLRHAGGNGYAFSSTGLMNTAAPGSAMSADIDGDGLEDLVYARPNSHSIYWRRNLTTSSTVAFGAESLLWTSPYAADFPTTPFGTNQQRFRSTIRAGDFNGDGRADLLVRQQYDLCGGDPSCSLWRTEWHALASTGSALTAVRVFTTDFAPQLGDFNGDGLTDVVMPTLSGGNLTWLLHFATGSRGSSLAGFTGAIAASITAPTNGMALVLDWDADGRSDIVYPAAASGWQYCRGTDTGLESCQPSGIAVGSVNGSPIVLDANGDGLADVSYASGDWRLRLHAEGRPGPLARATDGLGNYVEFKYSTLGDRSVHVPAAAVAFPDRSHASGGLVVARVTRSDGIGGAYPTDYSYVGARVNLRGRGFLGFASRTSRDGRNGLSRTERYGQDASAYETLGSAYEISTSQANGAPLARTQQRWSRTSFGAGFEERRFPYVAERSVERYELDGQKVSESTERNTHDAYGTLTDRVLTKTEIAKGLNPGAQHVERLTVTGVTNDSYNWCLGLPGTIRLSRSHSLAGGQEQVRTDSYSWDSTRCRPVQHVVEPGNPALQVSRSYIYDTYGNLNVLNVTPYGMTERRTAWNYVESGRFLGLAVNAEGHKTTYNWDLGRARVYSIIDPNTLETRFSYDSFNFLTRVTRPDGSSTAASRAWCGSNCPGSAARYREVSTEQGVGGVYVSTVERGVDSFGREVYRRRDLPGGAQSVELTEYDAYGRLRRASFPDFCCDSSARWMDVDYDVLGRVTRMRRPLSAVEPGSVLTQWTHDGFATSRTDPLGRTTTWTSDVTGNIRRVVDPGNSGTEYEYDAFGNLITARDVYGSETRLKYNLRGFRTEISDPDAGRWVQEYLPTGELQYQTNPRGQKSAITYDRLSRPVRRIDADMATTWTWGNDPASRNVGSLVSLEAGGLKETYVYDPLARLSSKTATTGGKTYLSRYYYDATTGLPERYSYPTLAGETQFAVRYRRDRGLVTGISDAYGNGGTFWEALAWNPRGQVTEESLGNGVKISSDYDAVTGLLKRRTAAANGTSALQDVSLDWDANGNLIERRDAVRQLQEVYRYDSRDRLDDVRTNGVTSLDLDYDEVGNITYKSDVGRYRYDSTRPHAAVSAGGNVYSYDLAGAMVKANGTTIQWASYNLPTRITHPNGNSSTISYGIHRDRYRQVAVESGVTTDTLYLDGGLYERVTRGSSVTQRHHLAAGDHLIGVRVQPTGSGPTLRYLLTDHLGGVDALISEAGALTARLSYLPFGARRGGDGIGATPAAAEWQAIQATTSRGYTTHEHLDNLGLIHMNGRVYDPNLGRFLSPDPIVLSLLDPQGLNRYSYVGNNPLSATDPSGFALEGLKEAWNDLVRIMIDGARPSPLGVNFNFSSPGGTQGPDSRGSFTGPTGIGGPFSFGGMATVGAYAAWNIEAGWHLPHSPPPSAGAVAARHPANTTAPRTTGNGAVAAANNEPLSLFHLALDGLSASPVPIASQAAGVTSGLWYAIEGDWTNAGLSIAGTIPVVGTVADAARSVRTGSQLARYLKKVEALDVGTPRHGAVFYSGPGNRALAEEFARSNGRYTLEMTPGGKWLDEQGLFGPNSPVSVEDAIKVWSRLSQRYSQQASGVAVGFVSRSRSGSVFNSVEYPELLSNPNITNVITGGQ